MVVYVVYLGGVGEQVYIKGKIIICIYDKIREYVTGNCFWHENKQKLKNIMALKICFFPLEHHSIAAQARCHPW